MAENQKRILIVDDEASQRQLLGSFVQSLGFQVEQAGSAEEGLRLVKKKLPQMVLLDVSQLGPCRLPQLPTDARGVFLTGVQSKDELYRWQAYLESHCGVRLLGAIMDSSVIGQQWSKRSVAGGCPKEIVELLASQLSLSFRWDILSELANESLPTWTDEQEVTRVLGDI